jgi:hypothetical protein
MWPANSWAMSIVYRRYNSWAMSIVYRRCHHASATALFSLSLDNVLADARTLNSIVQQGHHVSENGEKLDCTDFIGRKIYILLVYYTKSIIIQSCRFI